MGWLVYFCYIDRWWDHLLFSYSRCEICGMMSFCIARVTAFCEPGRAKMKV